jgi:uncharacterized pyridoxal phosphate-containing UPF0001 family protein
VLGPAAVRARLVDVRERIVRAAARAGRDPSRGRLIAISKTFGADAVRAAALEGQIHFGENKLQEAQQKRQNLADLPLKWHLVGHLQSNKARKAVAEFDMIHSIDSVSLLERIDEAAAALHRRVSCSSKWIWQASRQNTGAREAELGPIFEAARKSRRRRPDWLDAAASSGRRSGSRATMVPQASRVTRPTPRRGVSASMLAELSMGSRATTTKLP